MICCQLEYSINVPHLCKRLLTHRQPLLEKSQVLMLIMKVGGFRIFYMNQKHITENVLTPVLTLVEISGLFPQELATEETEHNKKTTNCFVEQIPTPVQTSDHKHNLLHMRNTISCACMHACNSSSVRRLNSH